MSHELVKSLEKIIIILINAFIFQKIKLYNYVVLQYKNIMIILGYLHTHNVSMPLNKELFHPFLYLISPLIILFFLSFNPFILNNPCRLNLIINHYFGYFTASWLR